MKMSLKDILIEQVDEEEGSIEGLALLVDSGRHSTDYILYSPKYYAQKMKSEIGLAKEDFRDIKFKGKFDNFKDFYAFSNVQEVFTDRKGIYGYLSVNSGRMLGFVGSCNRANEIRGISAREGYGKILFKIALEKESPIMPNRDKVSDVAYDEYSNMNRDSRIEKDSFDNERALRTKSSADCSVYNDRVLDQSYDSKIEKDLVTNRFIQRHTIFLEQMKNFFRRSQVDYIQSRVKEYIADAGYLFFHEARGAPGWYENADVNKD